MRWIAPALAFAKRLAATALAIAPLAWTCGLFFSDLHERPPGRRVAEVAPAILEAPLEADESVGVPLAPDSIPYRAVAVRLEAAAPALVDLRLCGRGRCSERAMNIGSAEVMTLPVPADAAAGGALSLSPAALAGGPVWLRGDAATPALEVIQGYSWRLPARRARRVFRAMAGADVFDASLSACALGLCAAFLVCIVLALRRDIAP